MLKIENWNRLDGQMFSVMGIEFQFEKAEVADDGRYTVWLNEEISNSPISLMRVDLYIDDMQIDIKTFLPNSSAPPHHTHKKITKDHIKDPSIFTQTIGMIMMADVTIRTVLDYLDEIAGNVGARGGMSGGINRIVMNSGTFVTHSYAPSSGLSGSSGNNLW